MEISTEELISIEKKNDENESQNLSDGEIIDDDDLKNSTINVPLQKKLQKNFRVRHSDHSDESDDDSLTFEKKSGESAVKSSKESRKLNSRIENGDEKYLQNVRKKIISELKDNSKDRDSSKRSDNQKHYNDRRSSFHRDEQFRRSSNNFDRMRPPPTPNSSFSHFRRSNDRNFTPRNSFNDRRENGKVKPDMLEVRSVKGSFSIYFPKSSIKYTKTQPSISFAENPRVKRRLSSTKRESTSTTNKQDEKSKDQSKKDKRRSRSKHIKSDFHEKVKESSTSQLKHTPKSKNEDQKAEVIEPNSSKIDIKLEEDEDVKEKVVPFKIESPSYSPITREKSSEKDIIDSSWKLEEHTPEQVTEERIKFEPIIIERKKIRKIEKPKVNIFLEDSDEVDEFENSITLEVKSKWSSPVPPPKLYDDFEEYTRPAIVPPPKDNIEKKKKNKIDIPVVIDSPEKSPITTGSDSIFDTPSVVSLSKSSTPQVKNVCSFLTDLESEGYLSSFSELYDNNNSDNEDVNEPICLDKVELATSLYSSKQEPDTTVDKLIDNRLVEIKDSDSESDSDDESSTSSSSSSSSSSSESSEESSDESTDDETSKIVNIFSGFGRFDATSMPMVTQIKPIGSAVQTTVPQPTESVTTRFQPHQSIIRPPALLTNLTKPPLYTPSPCISTPNSVSVSPIVPAFGQSQIPIPFKIYSLRDAGNNGMIFPQAAMSTSMQPPMTPGISEKEKDKEKEKNKEKDKRPEKREREKHRSRSHSRERDRKKIKEDRRDYERRKTPPKKRTPSPRRRSISPRRKHVDEKRDIKRRDFSPKHRLSHNSRHSPVRRNRRSPPSRGRTPPPKIRRLSPISKYRRSSSPSYARSPSPIYRRNRYSPSPINEQTHLRRTPSRSPEYDRYDRRSYSPSFRKMESPNNGYKPDSTISDTELERQQQFSQMNDYYSWNSSVMPSHSPRRPNLDDRINRMLSDSPTQNSSSLQYPIDSSYYAHHDNPQYPHPHMNHSHQNHQGFYYSDIYPHNQSFIPPPTNMDSRYQASIMMNNHAQSYEDNYNTFSSPRNFVNNSNLVEITQQKREKQRVGSNQIAVQVGNCLEIVPNNEIPSPQPVKPPVPKPLSPEEIKQQAEKKEQAKIRRKADRERKRMAKYLRKEKLRQEIQKHFDAGINIEDSDDEGLIKLRPINVNAIAERGIIKKAKIEEVPTAENDKEKEIEMVIEKVNEEVKKEPNTKKVLFKDGILPGETSSDNELIHDNEHEKRVKLKRKRLRKQRLNEMIKERKKNLPTDEMQVIVQKQDQLDTAPPPSPPFGSPPAHLKQPRLKNITPDMFAAFGVNVDPMYFHLHKIQMMQNEHSFQFTPRGNNPNNDNRYRYQNKHHNNSQYQPNYPQQRYSAPPKPHNSMDPRINQQRTAEKIFA